MPRKRTGYDAACYYDGKLLAAVPKRTATLYLLMNACGGDAARVLREYAYFSPELAPYWKMWRSCRRTGTGRAECSMRRKVPRGARCRAVKPSVQGCFWYLPPATAERWWQTR